MRQPAPRPPQRRTIAIGTVCYPAAEPFLGAWLRSVAAQTLAPDLIIIVDEDGACAGHLTSEGVTVVPSTGSPAQHRGRLFAAAGASGVDYLVVQDIDDWAHPNRIAAAVSTLIEADVVCGGLHPVDGEQFGHPLFSPRLERGAWIDLETLRFGNCLGMSNLSVRVAALGGTLAMLPDWHTAFDWVLATSLAATGARIIHCPDSITYYRVYEANDIGPPSLGKVERLRQISVKIRHYNHLAMLLPGYSGLAETMADTATRLRANSRLLDRYVEATVPAPDSFWWESCRSLEELGL